MANKIQIRRGLKSAMPIGSSGEPLWASDTRELYMGTGAGNVNMGGSHWYRGTALSGTSATANAYSYGACPEVKLDDMYLNTTNGNLYACTTAGKGNTAKWTYQGCIKGVKGDTGATGDASDYFPTNGYANMDELSMELSDMKEERLAPPTTITIGCADSKHQWLADYNPNFLGGADEALQQAINALPPSGGKISILEGEYTINEPLTCNKDVVFEGMGNGTVINVVDGKSLIRNTETHRIEFTRMKITANGIFTNYNGLFNTHESTKLHLDKLTVSSVITTNSTSDAGTVICTNSLVYCNDVAIDVNVTGSNITKCYMVFRHSRVYANTCDIHLTKDSSSYEAGIFYNCDGTVNGGNLHATNSNSADSRVCIMSETCDMQITACIIKCNRISTNSSGRGGCITNCAITITGQSCTWFCDISNCKIKGTRQMSTRGTIFTNNKIITDHSNSIVFGGGCVVCNNVSKCTLTNSTPSVGIINNNVVDESLS